MNRAKYHPANIRQSSLASTAATVNITRYIAFLARSKAYTSIQQYLSTLGVLYLELGLPHPIQDNYPITSLMKAVRRVEASPVHYKLPLSMDQSASLCKHLDHANIAHNQPWTIILSCFFFCLPRISNVTVPKEPEWDSSKTLLQRDVTFNAQGCILKLLWSKTIQYQQHTVDIPLPYLRGERYVPCSCPFSCSSL